jgi:hypothetical protein
LPTHAPNHFVADLVGRDPKVLLFAATVSHTNLKIFFATRASAFHDSVMAMALVDLYGRPQASNQSIRLNGIGLSLTR